MKLISYTCAQGPAVGLLNTHADTFVPLQALAPQWPGDLLDLLERGPDAMRELQGLALQAQADAGLAWQPLSSVTLLPVVPRPRKVICVGLNYAAHASEGGNARPEHPAFFLRGATSLSAHGAALAVPRVSDKFDYEAELAVVIGTRVRHAAVSDALGCVAGYTCFNDGTLRDYQRRTAQWTLGKNFDATGPLGPWLVTPDELPPGARGLRICSRLNGQLMQDANTRDMLWPVAELIALLSECMTLEPGDVIATGTPAGVGYARTPPVFMAGGDVIEIEIEGLGSLSNPIVCSPD
jgi:acylpyruvate hydrolase